MAVKNCASRGTFGALGVMCKNTRRNKEMCKCPSSFAGQPVKCTTWLTWVSGEARGGHDYCAYTNCLKEKAICGGLRVSRNGKCCAGTYCAPVQPGSSDRLCEPTTGPCGNAVATKDCKCGTATCTAGQRCVNGQCIGPCGTGVATAACHCGTAVCPAGYRCVNGQCLAPVPACGTSTVTYANNGCQCGRARCQTGQRCVQGQCIAPAPSAPPCGCGTITAAGNGCQCGSARCSTGQRCVKGQGRCVAATCKHLKRIPMAGNMMEQCKQECMKTYCTAGCQSYNLQYGYSDAKKNGCFLSTCPYTG